MEAKKCLKLKKSLAEIKKNNANPKTHDSGVTSMSAKTDDEMKTINGYIRPQGSETMSTGKTRVTRQTSTVPASKDWRTLNAVTPVKNQGINKY